MKVLVIGSGGREHALIWKIIQSELVDEIYAAEGNGGIAELAECVDIKVDNLDGLCNFAIDKKIDLTIVGPEAPLVAGIVDKFQEKGLRIFGPNKAAAQLEGSKVFAKEFMVRHNIPTARFKVFDDSLHAKDYINEVRIPLVVKVDGLAAGKGAIVCGTKEEALEAVEFIMERNAFKEAGRRIVIEECLEGEEVSILVISDGENFVTLDSSQDHKRIYDNDRGPNTGGMGAYSPAPIVTQEMFEKIKDQICSPTIKGMLQDGNKFKGILYAGLMITKDGPKVLEYNVRFGDPETQAVLPRLKSDLVQIVFEALEGKLHKVKLQWDNRACVCVVMASGGYPGSYEKNKLISGLDAVKKMNDIIVFHAGTRREDGKIFTSGGRVLGVTGLGRDIRQAIDNTYRAVEKINFEKAYFRKDIGFRAIGGK
jgi:phosphoribosylamine--glycine ligase